MHNYSPRWTVTCSSCGWRANFYDNRVAAQAAKVHNELKKGHIFVALVPFEPYIVPIDPADETQCDSCQ